VYGEEETQDDSSKRRIAIAWCGRSVGLRGPPVIRVLANRVGQTVMTASFLQASLFTSVVAFGVAALAAGLGVVFLLIGIALRRVAAAVRIPEVAAVS
jgi:hypothetical protein